MAPIPDNVLDKDKYREAIKAADESYKVPSAYKSMYIVRIHHRKRKYRMNEKEQIFG